MRVSRYSLKVGVFIAKEVNGVLSDSYFLAALQNSSFLTEFLSKTSRRKYFWQIYSFLKKQTSSPKKATKNQKKFET